MIQLTIAVIAALCLVGCHPAETDLRPRCIKARDEGLKFLDAHQGKRGDFATYYWSTSDPGKLKPVHTNFTVSQILYSLTFCDDTVVARRLKERAVAYLLDQREAPGVWRYYDRASGVNISPDLDDTAMAWAALQRAGHSVIPEALRVIRQSRNDAGLFNTWIGDPSSWVGFDSSDIDAVVNLNVLLLFGLANESFDTVCKYATEQIDNDLFRRGTIYYPSPLAFTNALSRAYHDGDVLCLQNTIPRACDAALSLQHADGGWGNDLETALGLLTLLNARYKGPALERGVSVILARQSFDGGWALAPAYRAAVAPWRYGSRSLTVAVCLEALTKYLKQ